MNAIITASNGQGDFPSLARNVLLMGLTVTIFANLAFQFVVTHFSAHCAAENPFVVPDRGRRMRGRRRGHRRTSMYSLSIAVNAVGTSS